MALSVRVDALGEDSEPTVAKQFKDYVEGRLAVLEEGNTIDASRKHLKKANLEKVAAAKADTKSGSNVYNQEADAVTTTVEPAADGEKKKKKKKRSREEAETVEEKAVVAEEEPAAKKSKEEGEKKKKKKSKK